MTIQLHVEGMRWSTKPTRVRAYAKAYSGPGAFASATLACDDKEITWLVSADAVDAFADQLHELACRFTDAVVEMKHKETRRAGRATGTEVPGSEDNASGSGAPTPEAA